MRCRLRCVAFASLFALVFASCQDVPTSSSADPPVFLISDAAHGGSNEHFYFLPPMVSAPEYQGVFDGELSPAVEICEWTGSACTPVLATYTMTSGPGSETVRVELDDQHYIVNWHTDVFPLDADKTYRIRVLVEGTQLGFADVDVVSSGKDLRSVNTGEYIPLLDGRTLPIKFRIEKEGVDRVWAGGSHTCALTVSGTAYCWGAGWAGQLGDGNLPYIQAVPVAVSGGIAFSTLSVGGLHTCGLATTGEAYCWGLGNRGQRGDNTTTDYQSTPVEVWGSRTYTAIAAGGSHTCAIATGGATYCWGLGSSGQLGDGQTTEIQPVPVEVVGGLTFSAITAGDEFNCGRTADGTAYCWGGLGGPTPGPVSGEFTFLTVSAGGYHSCGITTGGVGYCWGWGYEGQLGIGVAANSDLTPLPVAAPSLFTAITGGGYHTCGIAAGGAAYCWGRGDYGERGDGTDTYAEYSPVAVVGGLAFKELSAGFYHTCGLTTAGAAYCWGYGVDGRLGNGIGDHQLTPVAVLPPSDGWQ